jgi:hypothetical protein
VLKRLFRIAINSFASHFINIVKYISVVFVLESGTSTLQYSLSHYVSKPYIKGYLFPKQRYGIFRYRKGTAFHKKGQEVFIGGNCF